MRDAVIPTAVPQLHLAPSTMDLSGLELEIGRERDRAFRLRTALHNINNGTERARRRDTDWFWPKRH
jgi:chromosome partitioning protein